MNAKRAGSVEIIIWVFVLILISLILTPIGLGFKVKNDYKLYAQKISHLMQLDVNIVKYERGLFTSDVVVEFQHPDVSGPLRFKETIYHGPVYFGLFSQGKSPFVAAVVKGELMPMAAYENIINKTFSGKAALVYQNVVDFAGNVDTELYMPAFKTVVEQQQGRLHIESSSSLVSQYYSSTENKVSGELSLSALSVRENNAMMTVNNLNFSFSGQVGNNNILIGDSILAVAKLDVRSDLDQFALAGFSISSVNTEVGDVINSQIRFNSRELLLSSQKLGPIEFTMEVNGLSADSINELTELQKTRQHNIEQAMPEDQADAMFIGQVFAIIPNLLKQAVITIDPLSVQSELGKLKASVNLSVDDLDSNFTADPMFLLSAINLDVDVLVDEALLKQLIEWQLVAYEDEYSSWGNEQARKIEASIPLAQKANENLKGLLDENWFNVTEGKYRSHIVLQQGIMLVNDIQIDPIAQMMSTMGAADDKTP